MFSILSISAKHVDRTAPACTYTQRPWSKPQRLHLHPKALEQAAAGGHPFASSLLGAIYARGDSIPTDLKRAAAQWQHASRLKEPEAQFVLGCAYAKGDPRV
jgi:TPR repeat protein